jgi:hypothetical protein
MNGQAPRRPRLVLVCGPGANVQSNAHFCRVDVRSIVPRSGSSRQAFWSRTCPAQTHFGLPTILPGGRTHLASNWRFGPVAQCWTVIVSIQLVLGPDQFGPSSVTVFSE